MNRTLYFFLWMTLALTPVVPGRAAGEGVSRGDTGGGSGAGRDASAAKLPKPGSDHQRLAAMCGTWDLQVTFWLQPGAPGVTSPGTSSIKPLFDGLFIEEKIEGKIGDAPFTTLAWTGFNTSTHLYEATRIASTNTIRIPEAGPFDEKTGQLELKADYPFAGDTWHQRTVIKQSSQDSMIATSYLSFGTTSEWKGVEIKYTRRTK